jgi:hypothetical protein
VCQLPTVTLSQGWSTLGVENNGSRLDVQCIRVRCSVHGSNGLIVDGCGNGVESCVDVFFDRSACREVGCSL